MSIHISAKDGEIAPIVLMPGDPLRAKHIAENYLQDCRLVSSTRNIFFYTGTYISTSSRPSKGGELGEVGVRLTIGASGMGCPSMGIYSYELYNDYRVKCIMRIGTCGAYRTDIQLYDLINAERAFSESTYAQCAFGYKEDHFNHQGNAYAIINQTAKDLQLPLRSGTIHSGDPFYRHDPDLPRIATENNCLAAEMEAFALFANAKHLGKMAACLLTVSDIIPSRQKISADERERSLDVMTRLGLESAVGISRSI